MEPFNFASVEEIASLTELVGAALMIEADRRAEHMRGDRPSRGGTPAKEPGEKEYDLAAIMNREIKTAADAYWQTVEILCGIYMRPLEEVHQVLLKAGTGWTLEQIEEIRKGGTG